MILELNNINKSFINNDKQSFAAVKNVNMHLGKGECIGIVGESGCGKSTLARIICHLTYVDNGNIFFKGRNSTRLKGKELKDYYKNVQMVFQDPLSTFSPRMKIGDYLMEPFVNFKIMGKKEARKYVGDLLENVGLSKEYLNRYPNELSGGQLQRVVIARCIGINPEIIIFDEATSCLDVSIQNQILKLIFELRQKSNFSSIFITHDLAIAENICDRIYVMKSGEIVEVLEENNIVREAQHPYTKLLLESSLVFS
ncbi:MAG: ABC transporter ATP-binding protein [Clostridiaceae bacterium]|nr:ABC transporter ATP-binding protein [Clostridiaceae bacterium]